jgi:pimeloyl-ACP methyl ester carboxylesterase
VPGELCIVRDDLDAVALDAAANPYPPQRAAGDRGGRAEEVFDLDNYPERWDGKGGSFSLRQHVADVATFIEMLKAGPVHLVGHSRGSSLALYVASGHGDRVRTLTVAEGGVNMPAFDPTAADAGGSQRPTPRPGATAATMFEQGNIEGGGLAYFMDAVRGPGPWKAAPEADRQIYRDNASTIKGMVGDKLDP